MPRIRTIKPEFFDDPKMADVSPLARLTFIGLWTQVDKAGRILYEPKRLKVRILPFDDCDVDAVVGELVRIGVVTVYEVDDRKVLQVNAFLKHQRPHPREPESDLPDVATAKSVPAVKENGQPCKGDAQPVRNGREGNVVGREQEGNVPPALPHTRPLRRMNPGAGAGADQRAHRSHVWCGNTYRVCVPDFLHEELVRRLGGENADARMRTFYDDCEAALDPDKPVGESVKFWRDAFALRFTTPTPKATSREPQWVIDARAAQARADGAA